MNDKMYTDKELIDMLWALRKAWMYRVIQNAADLNKWLDEMTDEERKLSGEFLGLMHRVTNPRLVKTDEAQP